MSDEQAAAGDLPAAAPAGLPHPSRRVLCGITVALVLCVLLQGGVAMGCLAWPPQDWNLVHNALGNLNTLAVMLAGGLLGISTPSRSTGR